MTLHAQKQTDRYHFETLQIVLKIAERCNINCSYCYYFNQDIDSSIGRPALISLETAEAIAQYVARGVSEVGIKRVIVSFHGGEPLLLKPSRFDEVCHVLRKHIEPVARLGLSVQTNGTILNEQWLEVFKAHEINVGVSIDGGRVANDRFRLDHRGRSTFDKVEGNLVTLLAQSGDGDIAKPGTISVVDPRNDYQHESLRGIGISTLSFLLPDRTHDVKFEPHEPLEAYGHALKKIADVWFEEDDPEVQVRQISCFFENFQKAAGSQNMLSSDKKLRPFKIMIIQSNGEVSLNDSYMPASDWYASQKKLSVFDSTLQEFLNQEVFDRLDTAEMDLAPECQSCRWVGICRGGDLENRYSRVDGFKNPSVYCSALKMFYETIENHLITGGFPKTQLEERLAEAARNIAVTK